MDFYLTPPTKFPIEIMLRKRLTPNLQRIKSICTFGTMPQQVLLIFIKSLGALCFCSYKNRIGHIATRLHTLNTYILSNVGNRTTSKQTNDLSICLTDAPGIYKHLPHAHLPQNATHDVYFCVFSHPYLLNSLFCLHSALSFVTR